MHESLPADFKLLSRTVLRLLFASMLLAGCAEDVDSPEGSAASTIDADQSASEEPVATPVAVSFSLAAQCPQRFQLNDDGRCEFLNPYEGFKPPWELTNLFIALPELPGPYTPQQIDLGRFLFFDPVLSGDQDVSCAHCHHPDDGFADAHGQSAGRGASGAGRNRRGGVELLRGAPSLWNIGFVKPLFVDGRAPDLQTQALGPLLNPDEMGADPQKMIERLNAIPAYQELFAQAFPDEQPAVALAHVQEALTAFQSTLVSFDSPYDRYTLGDRDALTEAQVRGHDLFQSFVTRCANCHAPPLFSDNKIVVIGAGEPDGKSFDAGAALVTNDPTLHGGFRTPQLHNIALTAPYMHSGVEKTLREAVAFYNEKRGHAVPEDEPVLIHWLIFAEGGLLSEQQVDDLTAFLEAMNDESTMPAMPERVPSGLPLVPRLE